MTTSLKPCPFCGNAEPRATVTDIGPGYQTSLVRCRNCPAEIGKSGLDAADYWNRRPTAWRNCASDPPAPNPTRVVLARLRDSEVVRLVMSGGWFHDRDQWCEVPE